MTITFNANRSHTDNSFKLLTTISEDEFLSEKYLDAITAKVIDRVSDQIAKIYVEENFNEIMENISAKAVAKMTLIEAAKSVSKEFK